jgi:hypothetical protein
LSSKNQSKQPSDSWQACPEGEFTQLVHRLDSRERAARRKQVFSIALASTAAFAALVLVVGLVLGPGGPNFGGISCAECREQMAEYAPHAAGKIVHQDQDLVRSMQTHLKHCDFCRDKFQAMYPEVAMVPKAAVSRWESTGPVLAMRRSCRASTDGSSMAGVTKYPAVSVAVRFAVVVFAG